MSYPHPKPFSSTMHAKHIAPPPSTLKNTPSFHLPTNNQHLYTDYYPPTTTELTTLTDDQLSAVKAWVS